MSDYQAGSTAKVYADCDGNERTLYQMVRHEPEWAQSKIIEGEKAIEQITTLTQEVADLKEESLSLTAALWREKDITELLTDKQAELVNLLDVAKCPCCDGSGAYYDNQDNVCQCQWCDEKTLCL